jgi:hypothetical protein
MNVPLRGRVTVLDGPGARVSSNVHSSSGVDTKRYLQ